MNKILLGVTVVVVISERKRLLNLIPTEVLENTLAKLELKRDILEHNKRARP